MNYVEKSSILCSDNVCRDVGMPTTGMGQWPTLVVDYHSINFGDRHCGFYSCCSEHTLQTCKVGRH